MTQPAPAATAITADDRMERLGVLTPKQCADALLWLSGIFLKLGLVTRAVRIPVPSACSFEDAADRPGKGARV